MKKNSYERILYIHRQLLGQMYPSRTQLANKFEVSIKTIERDLDYLRDRLEGPISYSRDKKGYYYTDPVFTLPALFVSQDEISTLFLSHYLSTCLSSTPLGAPATETWKRFSKLLPDEVIIDTTEVNKAIMMADPIVKHQSEYWTKLFRAILDKKVCRIYYRSPGYKEAVLRKVWPIRLVHHRNAWYLFTFDETKEDYRTYALSRLHGLKVLSDNFQVECTFNIEDFIDPNFGIFPGSGERFDIEIKTNCGVSDIILEHLPNATISDTKKIDDTVLIKFSTNQREELLHWILQWGLHLEVLKPVWLKAELLRIGNFYTKKYK